MRLYNLGSLLIIVTVGGIFGWWRQYLGTSDTPSKLAGTESWKTYDPVVAPKVAAVVDSLTSSEHRIIRTQKSMVSDESNGPVAALGTRLTTPPAGLETWANLQAKIIRTQQEEEEFRRISVESTIVDRSFAILQDPIKPPILPEGQAKREFAIEQIRTALMLKSPRRAAILGQVVRLVKTCGQRTSHLPVAARGEMRADCAALVEALLTYAPDVAASLNQQGGDAALQHIIEVGRELQVTREEL